MSYTLIINIQSCSDIITNSSSEVFIVQEGKKWEIEHLKESFEENWRRSGMGGEFEMKTIEEYFEELKEGNYYRDYEYYIREWDSKTRNWYVSEKYVEDFNEFIDYKLGFINIRYLNIDQFVKLLKLNWDIELTKDSIMIDVDDTNYEFIESLEKQFSAIML